MSGSPIVACTGSAKLHDLHCIQSSLEGSWRGYFSSYVGQAPACTRSSQIFPRYIAGANSGSPM